MPVERNSYVVRHVAKMPRMMNAGVRQAIESGKLNGNEVLPAKMVLMIDGVALNLNFDGEIHLE